MRRPLLTAAALLLVCAPVARAAGTGFAVHPSRSPRVLTRALAATRVALRYVGVPYVYGGSTPAGFDCSGFTRFVYARVGIGLAHSTYAQWDAGPHVGRRDLRPGDLVFFGLGHVGLYLGGGRFIHAPHTGERVSVVPLHADWYADTYSGAVRVRGSQAPLHPRRARPRRRPTTLPPSRLLLTPEASTAPASPAGSSTT